jgi:broad specificity phosphatase PhoE
MTTRLIIVRHGDSHHKHAGLIGGPRGCHGLTDLGRRQAARLAERLAGESIMAHLYASVIPRAIETAEILAPALGDPAVQQDCDLCTWHVQPEYDGTRWEDFKASHTQMGGGAFRPFERGSETWAELVARVGRALWGIAQRHQGQTTLVASHTETVEASFAALGNLPLVRGFDLVVSCCSLTEWVTDDDTTAWPPARWTLTRFNDAAHLARA